MQRNGWRSSSETSTLSSLEPGCLEKPVSGWHNSVSSRQHLSHCFTLVPLGDNVIIIIGGDDNYRDEDEESKEFISRWAKRKISSQFNDEYMDGRKGFILSWNKEHREIHEEVLRHFLDPSKRGTKFEYKPKLSSRPEIEKKEGCQQSKRDSFLDPSKRETKFEYKPERRLPPPPEPEKKERTQQSERDSFSEPSRTESAKLSSVMMKARSDPLQQAEQDSSLGRTTSHISSSELRSSSSGALRNVVVSSHKGTSSGLPETQRNSIGEIAVHLLFREKFKTSFVC